MFLFICHVYSAFFGRISYGDFGKLKKADDDNDMYYERGSCVLHMEREGMPMAIYMGKGRDKAIYVAGSTFLLEILCGCLRRGLEKFGEVKRVER